MLYDNGQLFSRQLSVMKQNHIAVEAMGSLENKSISALPEHGSGHAAGQRALLMVGALTLFLCLSVAAGQDSPINSSGESSKRSEASVRAANGIPHSPFLTNAARRPDLSSARQSRVKFHPLHLASTSGWKANASSGASSNWQRVGYDLPGYFYLYVSQPSDRGPPPLI